MRSVGFCSFGIALVLVESPHIKVLYFLDFESEGISRPMSFSDFFLFFLQLNFFFSFARNEGGFLHSFAKLYTEAVGSIVVTSIEPNQHY